MDRGFPAVLGIARQIALGAALALPGCIPIPAGTAAGLAPASSEARAPEEKLAIQSRALQRTVLEGAMLGTAAGSAADRIWARPTPVGLAGGFTVGTVSGTYLGYLQHAYATNEERLGRMRADLDATNAETEAAIQTMRIVLDRQSRDLEAIRARAGSSNSPELQAAVSQAESSLGDMQRAIAGASGREEEFEYVKVGQFPGQDLEGVDSQIAELGSRIAQMREIAGTLAGEL